MTTIGITGANGFIGKHLVRYLKNQNYEVIDSDQYCRHLSDYPNEGLYEFVSSSDIVVHLAGKNKGEEWELLDSNVISTYNIAKQCHKFHKPIIFAGTEYNKSDFYKCSKDISFDILKNFGNLGLNYQIINMPKVFGPGCKPFYNSFVSTILYCAANNEEYKHLIKDKDELLKLIYVEDVCRIFEKSIINNNPLLDGIKHCDDYSFFITIKDIIDIIEDNDVPFYGIPCVDYFLTTLESYREQTQQT